MREFGGDRLKRVLKPGGAAGRVRQAADALAAAGAKCELITWDNLDHELVDSSARAHMLRKSDEFLRQSLGL